MGRPRLDAFVPSQVANKSSAAPSAHKGIWHWPEDGARLKVQGALGRLVTMLDRAMAPFWNQPLLFLGLIGVAMWASIWGFISFYGPQYGRVPAYAIPFVPDSPLSTVTWIVSAIILKLGWDHHKRLGGVLTLFVAWATVMNAKVGIWTGFVLLFYYDHFFAGDAWDQAFQWMLVGSHLGMVVFAVLLVRKQRRLPAVGYGLVLATVLLWDFMDYFFVPIFLPGSGIGIYPEGVPDDPGPLLVVAIVTVCLTLAAWLYLVLGVRWRGPVVER